MMNFNQNPTMDDDDLDVVGAQFGVKIIKRDNGSSDLIDLYAEDDGKWYYVNSFAAYWLRDLKKVCETANELADTRIVRRSS